MVARQFSDASQTKGVITIQKAETRIDTLKDREDKGHIEFGEDWAIGADSGLERHFIKMPRSMSVGWDVKQTTGHWRPCTFLQNEP